MSSEDLNITEARKRLTNLPEDLAETPRAIRITRKGEPVLAVLPWEFYESLLETLEIMGDPELMDSLRKGVEDIKAGRLHSVEDIEKELGL
jgi:prevent-host-death family protein